MPPKTVTCAICSEVVLKAQTLARSDGSRACRSHDGVTEEAEAKRAAERARLDKAVSSFSSANERRWQIDPEEQRIRHESFAQEAADFRERVYTHCWTCGEYGLEGREFFSQALVAMKRLELRGDFNFFNYGQDVRKLMGNIALLLPIKSKNEVQDKAVIRHVRDQRIREIAPLLGFVLLCYQCGEKHGFKDRIEAMMPKPTWEQITNMAAIMPAMDPLLTEMAEKKEGQS